MELVDQAKGPGAGRVMLMEYENPGPSSRCVSGSRNLATGGNINLFYTYFTQRITAHEELFLERIFFATTAYPAKVENAKIKITFGKEVYEIDGTSQPLFFTGGKGIELNKLFRGEGTLTLKGRPYRASVYTIMTWNAWVMPMDRERVA
jgi:hypothetical protein